MEDKDIILSKLGMKDYRSELETVLDVKRFDDEAKNLILNIFYKLDNFYKDYVSVKGEVVSKNQYEEDLIAKIRDVCSKISIISPKEFTGERKYDINKKDGEIKCISNEITLLYAIYKVSERYSDLEQYNLKNFTGVCVNYVLVKASTINNVEPIRDFTRLVLECRIGR